MKVEKVVNKLVRKFNTTDPFKIAGLLNVHVQFLDLPPNCRGYYLHTLRRRFIAVNQNLSEVWQRVVCAHELGHDQLHRGISRFFLDEQSFFVAGRYECEANQFALRLLLKNEKPLQDEPSEHFLLRNHIPPEMARFYK
ncbi:ImmA/IrrE family metallo-endopeptidase [Paenibacillus sambharensis]|uniref:ImmA/IrrE family metallo-endopeptidase n=1 Tax=Paenibacillus sambharensis TaxID=1803190 RepID=A0A2W1LBX4_9BACL|nr:ImmA/IrrE family metallo-endopeptidase [Paenibacillus sambharensis]PZD96393.1 ImmA/IrrE family metallo-endopeptidase [Paenibacillus sambharensis]